MRLRCPRCGVGRLFVGWFRMHERCPGCDLKYERAPGYFLGSSYLNYGATALTLVVAYPLLHFGVGWTNTELTFPLVAWVMVFPLFFFRYARSLWLGMDYHFDGGSFDE